MVHFEHRAKPATIKNSVYFYFNPLKCGLAHPCTTPPAKKLSPPPFSKVQVSPLQVVTKKWNCGSFWSFIEGKQKWRRKQLIPVIIEVSFFAGNPVLWWRVFDLIGWITCLKDNRDRLIVYTVYWLMSTIGFIGRRFIT